MAYKALFIAFVLGVFPGAAVASQSDNRPSMVIAPVRVDADLAQVNRFDVDGVLHGELLSAVRDTRRFRVLERDQENLDAILREQDLEASSFSNSSDARAGRIAAAGYVAVPYITSFRFGASFRELDAFPGTYDRTDRVRIEASVRVVNSETGELVFIANSAGNYVAEVEAVTGRTGGPARAVADRLASEVANDLVSEIVNSVFPIMIADISGGDVYLNRGGDGINTGDRFDVYTQGRQLVDPLTNEPMGASVERLVGSIVVSRVEDRFSVARIVDGDESHFEIGAIVRSAE
ncbi:CsgG/HfaB family protein [Maricaulis sp.]|uniref:CsgG/HfaB family protein n=1 Tax=Maricaulis sp. TaxID=1486257 RepID=UPI0026217350|nr:CsgG/HfaB family protein [Maricaulis sp.]MDF1769479.1 CsgG/HfaB family protein [Maricaulis sp.]